MRGVEGFPTTHSWSTLTSLSIEIRNDFSSADVRRFWDGVADVYDRANDLVRDVHDQRYRVSFEFFPSVAPDTILNVWSRTGEAVEFLRVQHVSSAVINLEVSARLIEIARGRGRHGCYAQTDLTDLPVRTRSVDLVLSLETLEHCPDPARFIREIHRVLKPDGSLIMSCPPAFAEGVLRVYETFAFNHGEGPHRFLSSRVVKRLLEQEGFEVLHHRGTLFFPFKNRVAQWIDRVVERPLNALGLSDLGIRQFFYARPVDVNPLDRIMTEPD